MDTDLILILGLIFGAMSAIGILGAISDGRGPRASALSVLISGGMVLYALTAKPGGYELQDIPDVFYSVVGRFLP